MKKFIVIFLLLPIKLLAQDFSGVWAGAIFNDTTQKYIPYEIAINENNGKLTGFSHVIFLINGKEETGVKSVKIKRKDDQIFIEDEELIYNNYAEPAPKGVKQRSTLTISQSNSGMILSGPFSTNRTKEYYPVTGTIKLIKKKDFSQTKIIPKLSELNLSKSLSFLQNKNDDDDVAILARMKNTTAVQQTTSEVKVVPAAIPSKQVVPDVSPLVKEQEELLSIPEKIKTSPIATTNTKEKTISKAFSVTRKPVLITPALPKMVVADQLKEIKKDPIVSSSQSIEKNPVASSAVSAKSTPSTVSQKIKEKEVTKASTTNPSLIPQPKEKIIVKTQTAEIKKPATIPQPAVTKKEIIVAKTENKISPNQIISAKKESANTPDIRSAIAQSSSISAADLAKRKIETIKSVYFKSDSLTLTLYDNGEVDGDTVSVILNGKVIMPRVGLSTIAIKKTIYITPDLGDSLQIIMYAENLGSIPPNTGLLILQDGDDRYEIRFAGDLQKNSAITLRRKKSE